MGNDLNMQYIDDKMWRCKHMLKNSDDEWHFPDYHKERMRLSMALDIEFNEKGTTDQKTICYFEGLKESTE